MLRLSRPVSRSFPSALSIYSGTSQRLPSVLSPVTRLAAPPRHAASSRQLSFLRRTPKIPSGQQVVVTRIKEKKPFGRRLRRLVGSLIAFHLMFTIYKGVVLDPLNAALDDMEDEDDDEEWEDADEDDGEDTFVIPFPFTTKKLDPEPYAGSDPEWKEFVRISRDKQLCNKIIEDARDYALDRVKSHRLLTARLGRDLKVEKYWLELDFPLKAPPEYERWGIIITDEVVGLAVVSVDSKVSKLVDRVLWPTPVALSLWEVAKALAKHKAQEVAQYFGLESRISSSSGPTSPNGSSTVPSGQTPEIQKALQRFRQQATKRPEDVSDPGAISSANKNSSESSQSQPANKPSTSSVPGASGNKREAFPGHAMVTSLFGFDPWVTFTQKYAQVWKPLRPDPPRGSIGVSGTVSMVSPKGRVVIEMLTHYNPKTKAIDPDSAWLAVRSLKPHHQNALR